jgi:adenylate cyclase
MIFEELKRRNVIKVGVTYVVAAWVLLQVVDLLAPALDWPDSVTRVAIYALVIGFPITLLLSWFYEITPDGITLDEDADPTGSGSRAVDSRLNLIVIGLLCAAVILFAYDKWWPREALDPSVAVLPFVNMSGLEENEYFSDGLTETLLHTLAQYSELRVSSRTSAFAFKGKNIDIRDIALELGVAHILEGSVQRVGDNVRITAQLIQASDGTHLWSAKYDRAYDDIFVIHDEIATTVAEKLSRSLLGGVELVIPEGIATSNTVAFDFYLQALAEFKKSTFESVQNAANLLTNALKEDPDFTDAKALLAETFASRASKGAMDSDIGYAQATALYEQVLAEQLNHIGARAFFLDEALYHARGSGDIGAQAAAIDDMHALVIEAPNSIEARMLYARNLGSDSLLDEAIEQYQVAISLDPLNWEPRVMIAVSFRRARQFDAAKLHLNRALEITPNHFFITVELGILALSSGDAVSYIQQLQKGSELDPLDFELSYMIAKILYELELIEEGDRFRRQVNAIAPSSPAAQALQIVRAIRADSEKDSLAVARQLIRDDADDRLEAWSRAFRHLMLTAVLRGRTHEELAFVMEYVPNFADWDINSVPWKVGVGRAQTLEIWRVLDTDQGVLDRVDHTVEAFAAVNWPISRTPHAQIDVLLLQGDLEGAIDAALTNLFSHSVLEHLNIKDYFVTPLYADFVADPRIAEALERWDDELAQAREDVRQYLAE